MIDQFDKTLPALTAVSLLILAGPASASGNHEGGHTVGFGEPARASQADRTVRITARDTMTFSPDIVTVQRGETVTFVVDNVGRLQHSFTLGTPSSQREHEKEMEGMPMDQMAGHMKSDPTGMVLQGGETGKLTWRFTSGGPVEFACHIPGHYPAGMKGRLRIE